MYTTADRPSKGVLVTTAVLGALLLLLAALVPGCPVERDSASDGPITTGVTDNQIFLGSSLALEGHAGYLGSQLYHGAMAYIREINAQGGVHGRRIVVRAYDDSYEPPQCLANTQRLIIEDQVFALFSYVGTPTTVKVVPMIEDAEIPLVGMFTGANGLREPYNPLLINIRPSYYQETAAIVRHLVEGLEKERIAVFYQFDAYGFDGLAGTELALRQYDLTPVARGSYIRGTLDVSDALRRIRTSRADAVVMIGTSKPCAKLIQMARHSGYTPTFYALSFVGAEDLAQHLARYSVDDASVFMSQVVPPPTAPASEAILPLAREYIQLLNRYYPEERPNVVGLEGYLNARVLVEGLRRAGRDLTRGRFLQAFQQMRDFDLGGRTRIRFGPRDNQGLDEVYLTRLQDGAFRLLEGIQELKD